MESKIHNQPPRLCLALDGVSRDELFSKWLPTLGARPLVLKMGLGSLPDYSKPDFEKLSQKFKIFIDAKLHDIPTQVQSAVKKWGEFQISYLTLHLSGGAKMLELAQKEASKSNIQLLGVSVLTSLNEKDLLDTWGHKDSLNNRVLELVSLGISQGLSGFVSSAADLPLLKKKMTSDNILWVNPGIHWPGENPSTDQKRSVDFKEALANGSKMLVMGRSILESPEYLQRIDQVLTWIEQNYA